MTGLNDTCALKARNHGSATAGISEGSFRSKTMEPDLWPLSSAKKYAASGFKSPRIFSIVVPKVPALAAAFPASTGIETLSNIRIPCTSSWKKQAARVYTQALGRERNFRSEVGRPPGEVQYPSMMAGYRVSSAGTWRKEPNMSLSGVDYHPGFQTIAFCGRDRCVW